jgi:site-specific recombinase XerD
MENEEVEVEKKEEEKKKPKKRILQVIYKNRKVIETGKKSMSEFIYELGQKYLDKVREKTENEKRIGSASRLVSVLYFLYLTGARVSELFIKPPKINLVYDPSSKYFFIEVERVNEKHFVLGADKQKEREVIVQEFPLNDEYEVRMWGFITNDFIAGKEYTFDLSNFIKGKSKRQTIRILLSRAFEVPLKNPVSGEVKLEPLTPHVLRHARAYNLRIEQRLADLDVVRTIGWRNPYQLYNYVDILQGINREEIRKNLIKIYQERGYINPKKWFG